MELKTSTAKRSTKKKTGSGQAKKGTELTNAWSILKTGVKLLKNPWVLGAALGSLVCITDQLFKDSIERQPDDIFPHDVLEENPESLLEFRKQHNSGIAMNAFTDSPDAVKALSAAGMGAAALDLATRKKTDPVGIVSDLVVLGGASSNMIDRARRGYVVDYLHLKKGPLSRIVFNIGDAAIAAGSIAGSIDRAIIEALEKTGERNKDEKRKRG